MRTAINNAGVVVGESSLAENEPGWPVVHAFIYQRDKMTDLNTLVQDANGWELVDAKAINDAQQILAKACRLQTCQWVLLTSGSTAH